jgi:hypothetical protein
MLIPSLALTKKHLFVRWRLCIQMGVIFTDCRLTLFDRRRSLCRQLRKWWTGGRIMEMWLSCPIVYSSSADVVVAVLIIFVISDDHAVNFLMGREMASRRKSHNHPKIIFVSLRRPSAESLCGAAMLGQGIGSLSWTQQEHASIVRSGAASNCCLLLQSGRSRPRPMRLSI